ncbi:hypothetical protein [Ferroacidibacillus organovorans]|uniref:Uncharacterized protein n=1 Tax=Ferroacidibacillus organovorans TaxID=1765683 RepID=A0A117SYD9_9BACL|nr:hypothetical protein [Ferroacidibacillus organovorans]KUO96801.1 hypothetical protein ATW55_08270 [Ferroacidibacillus organovorans]
MMIATGRIPILLALGVTGMLYGTHYIVTAPGYAPPVHDAKAATESRDQLQLRDDIIATQKSLTVINAASLTLKQLLDENHALRNEVSTLIASNHHNVTTLENLYGTRLNQYQAALSRANALLAARSSTTYSGDDNGD